MRSDKALRALLNISQNIRLARDFIAGMDFSAFCADEKTLYAYSMPGDRVGGVAATSA
jgi:uncharacterized protein with HEPN domain